MTEGFLNILTGTGYDYNYKTEIDHTGRLFWRIELIEKASGVTWIRDYLAYADGQEEGVTVGDAAINLYRLVTS